MNQNLIYLLIFSTGFSLGGLVFKNINSKTQSSVNQLMPASDPDAAKNYKQRVFRPLIKKKAKDLQACYLQYLEDTPKITEGILGILVKIEENGKLSSMQTTQNEFNNQEIQRCIEKKITSYYIAPPPIGINRFISYELSFMSEETAKKKAIERAAKNKPPQIIPVESH